MSNQVEPTLVQAAVDTSIVLITCNRAASAAAAVRALLAQESDPRWPFELIVVDDGSTDNTSAVLTPLLQQAAVPATLVHTIGLGVPAARNAGIHAARGRWIAFFDDDQMTTSTWLISLRVTAETSRAACVGGGLLLRLPHPASESTLGPRARALLGEQRIGPQICAYPKGIGPASNNVLIDRALITKVGPFDESFRQGGSDADFFDRAHRSGAALVYTPHAAVEHLIPAWRTQPPFIRWVGHKTGAVHARMLHKQGRPGHAFAALARRLLILFARDLPALAAARLRRNVANALDVRCSLWCTAGLVRGYIALKFPTIASSRRFLAELDFRQHSGERSV